MRACTIRAAVCALGVAGLLSAGVVVTTTSAYAVATDNGWTHLNNHNYPAGSTNPECQPAGGGQGCVGWNDDTAQGVPWPDVNINLPAGWKGGIFYNDAVKSINNFVNPVGSGVASDNSPIYAVGGPGATVYVGAESLSASLCGQTNMTWTNKAPNNHGANQQLTLTGGRLWLNTNMKYDDTGTFTTGLCELRWTYNHEFGHTLGLGHTKYSNETMYSKNVAIYTAQTGDKHGVSCIYNLQNC